MPLIRIVLADDHTVVRAGIRAMLEGLGGIEIVGEATNGREALALVEQHQPHLLLADISMPEMNGLEATTRVVKEFPNVRVIILSMHTSEEYVWQALRAGATGYLLKDTEAAELDLAIKAVLNGTTYLTPAVSKQVVEMYMERMGNYANVADVLTPRQREILQLIAEGKALKEIAQMLKISVKTVETHRSLLMNRLDIHDTSGLVRYAMRMGMIRSEK
ncbi:MAG: response regulator transcription factor [Planctomycetaceae bacterium]|nr:response regulator transcription factor [Planctomycetaceae bacterium]